MATGRREGGSRSLVWTVLGLSLLAVPGFILGLLVGVAWEDPGLVLGHLFGRSELVAWSDETPDVAAERATPAESQAPAPQVAASEEPPPVSAPPRPSATRIRPEVISPGAPAARFAVQVGAFTESRAAERLAESLRAKGFDVYVSPGAKAGEARWRVRVGPLPSRAEAKRVAARLKAEEKLPTWVLDEDGAV
jgi:cell division septation protein DedD